jgi:hypothetical protein
LTEGHWEKFLRRGSGYPEEAHIAEQAPLKQQINKVLFIASLSNGVNYLR